MQAKKYIDTMDNVPEANYYVVCRNENPGWPNWIYTVIPCDNLKLAEEIQKKNQNQQSLGFETQIWGKIHLAKRIESEFHRKIERDDWIIGEP